MDKDMNSPNEQLLYIVSQLVSPLSLLLVNLLSQETAAALLYGKHFLVSSCIRNLKFHSSFSLHSFHMQKELPSTTFRPTCNFSGLSFVKWHLKIFFRGVLFVFFVCLGGVLILFNVPYTFCLWDWFKCTLDQVLTGFYDILNWFYFLSHQAE